MIITYFNLFFCLNILTYHMKALYDKSIVDYEVGKTMVVQFVICSLNRAIKNNDTSNIIIDSGQGLHFTYKQYINFIRRK